MMDDHVKNRGNKSYQLYTLCYCLFIVPMLYIIVENQYILIGADDARTQHYPVMYYTGVWIREVITSLLQGDLQVPMIDFRIGMGDDIIYTLNYYGFGDPFYLLAALMKDEWMPYFYSVLFYIRVYLGGIAFLLFTSKAFPNKDTLAYVTGAFLYVFSGFTILANVHVIFIHALMYIPLMLYGAENVLRGGRKRWITLTVAPFAMTGFFFLYVGSITMAVYVILRMLFSHADGIKMCLVKIAQMLAAYLMGLALGAFIFIPEIVGLFQSNRTNDGRWVRWVYSVHEYKEMFYQLFMAQGANFQTMAIPIIGILSIAVLVLAEYKWKEKFLIIVGIVSFACPAVSLAMCGFVNTYDRWEIVLVLLTAILVLYAWDELLHINKFELLGIFNLYLLFLVVGYYDDMFEDGYYQNTVKIFTGFLITLFVIFWLWKKYKSERITRCLLFVVSIITICIGWKNNVRYRDVSQVQEQNVLAEMDLEQDEFYRIESERTFGEDRTAQNYSMLYDYYGTAEYFSIENYDYENGLKEWQAETAGINHVGLDRRTVLESLCSVKYMLLYTEHDYLAPYGFKQIQTSADEVWSLYENQYVLPIGYTYSETIDYDAYLDMDGIEKQNAMLKSVALQGYDGSLLSDNSELTDYTYEIADYVIIDSQNVEVDDTYIHTAQDCSLTIAVTLKEDCENYLFINTQTTNTYVTLEDTELYLRGNQLANLGYSEQNREIEVTIYFGAELELTLNQIYMGYYNLGQYAADIAQRSEDCMENVEMSANTITGNLSLSEDRILCMSVPYLKGWRAWIDGEETTVYLANSMLMAIEVPAGEHEITFTYCTPGIRLGCAVTGIAAVLCVIILIRKRKAVRNG